MLKIFKKNIFFKKSCTNKHEKKYCSIFSMSFKQNKKRLLLLIPQNKGDRVFIVLKTKMLTKYRGKGIRYFKNQIFHMNQFFLIDSQSKTFLLINIILIFSLNHNCRIVQKISSEKFNLNIFAFKSSINK